MTKREPIQRTTDWLDHPKTAALLESTREGIRRQLRELLAVGLKSADPPVCSAAHAVDARLAAIDGILGGHQTELDLLANELSTPKPLAEPEPITIEAIRAAMMNRFQANGLVVSEGVLRCAMDAANALLKRQGLR